jgi:hypothetical protein
VAQFEGLWRRSGCEVVSAQVLDRWTQYLDLLLRFPRAFTGRGLTLDDLTVHSIAVLLRRPEG